MGFAFAAYEAGDILADGSTAQGTRIYYGITENGAAYNGPQINVLDSSNFLTAEGRALLDQSIALAFPPCFALGNLVFVDANGNDAFDAGEGGRWSDGAIVLSGCGWTDWRR